MTTAEIAIVISSLALLVSLGNLLWSIWSKFIEPRPRVRIQFSVMVMAGEDNGLFQRQAIRILATNLGPNDVVIDNFLGKSKRFRWFRFVTQHCVLLTSSSWPQKNIVAKVDFGNFPKRIEVGDHFAWYLPIENRYFTEFDMTHFGLSDTFGRIHWASKKSVREVRKNVLEAASEGGN